MLSLKGPSLVKLLRESNENKEVIYRAIENALNKQSLTCEDLDCWVKRFRKDLNSENVEDKSELVRIWVAFAKKSSDLCVGLIKEICGGDWVESVVGEVISAFIVEQCLNLEECFSHIKDKQLVNKLIDILVQTSESTPLKPLLNFIHINTIRNIFQTKDDRVRFLLCTIVLKLTTTKYALETCDKEIQGHVLYNFKNVYILVIEDLRKASNRIWFQLCIFTFKYFGKLIHAEIEMLNSVLSNIEHGFKSKIVQDKILSYDCWKALIDVASLDRNYLCSGKQLKLLVKPLKINLSRNDQVICKRLEVWLHLFVALQENSLQFLEEFMNFCFGAQTPLLNNFWLQRTEIFINIIGHYDPQDYCISPQTFKLDKPLINETNLLRYKDIALNALSVCSENILSWEVKIEREKKIRCMWGSILKIVGNLQDFDKELILRDLFVTMAKFWKKSIETQDYFDDILQPIFNVVCTLDEETCDYLLLNEIIVFPLAQLMLNYPDIPEYKAIAFIKLLRCCSKTGCRLDYLNRSCELIKSYSQNKTQILSAYIWLELANEMLSVCRSPKDEFDAFKSSCIFLMCWICECEIPDNLDKVICEKWVSIMTEIDVICEDLKMVLLLHFEKVLKENPTVVKNILGFIPYCVEKITAKSSVSYVMKVMDIVLEILKIPCLTTNKISLIFPIITKVSITVSKGDTIEYEILGLKLFESLEYFLKPHKAYEILKTFKTILPKLSQNLRKRLPSKLRTIIIDLTTHSNPEVAQDAISLIADLDKQEQVKTPIVKPVVSSRTAKIASMTTGRIQNDIPLNMFPQTVQKSPMSVKGSIITNMGTLKGRITKIANAMPSFKKINNIDDANSNEFVHIDSKVNVDYSKMVPHQKEMFKKRRDDIPALYQDLSQSQETSESLSRSNDSNSLTRNDNDKKNLEICKSMPPVKLKVMSPTQTFKKNSNVVIVKKIIASPIKKSEIGNKDNQSVNTKVKRNFGENSVWSVNNSELIKEKKLDDTQEVENLSSLQLDDKSIEDNPDKNASKLEETKSPIKTDDLKGRRRPRKRKPFTPRKKSKISLKNSQEIKGNKIKTSTKNSHQIKGDNKIKISSKDSHQIKGDNKIKTTSESSQNMKEENKIKTYSNKNQQKSEDSNINNSKVEVEPNNKQKQENANPKYLAISVSPNKNILININDLLFHENLNQTSKALQLDLPLEKLNQSNKMKRKRSVDETESNVDGNLKTDLDNKILKRPKRSLLSNTKTEKEINGKDQPSESIFNKSEMNKEIQTQEKLPDIGINLENNEEVVNIEDDVNIINNKSPEGYKRKSLLSIVKTRSQIKEKNNQSDFNFNKFGETSGQKVEINTKIDTKIKQTQEKLSDVGISLQNNEEIVNIEEEVDESNDKLSEGSKRKSLLSIVKTRNQIKEKINQSDSNFNKFGETSGQKDEINTKIDIKINTKIKQSQEKLSDVGISLQNNDEIVNIEEDVDESNNKSPEGFKRESLLSIVKTRNQTKEKINQSDSNFNKFGETSGQKDEINTKIDIRIKQTQEKLPNVGINLQNSDEIVNIEEDVDESNNKSSEGSKRKSLLSIVKTRNQIKEKINQSDSSFNKSGETSGQKVEINTKIDTKIKQTQEKLSDVGISLQNNEEIVNIEEDVNKINNKSPEGSKRKPSLLIVKTRNQIKEKNNQSESNFNKSGETFGQKDEINTEIVQIKETLESHSLQNKTEDIINSEEHNNKINKSVERPKRRSMISSLKTKNKIKEKDQSDSLLKSSNENQEQKQINKEGVENQRKFSDVVESLQNIIEDIMSTELVNETKNKSIEKSKRKSLLNLKTRNQIKEKSDEKSDSFNTSGEISADKEKINTEIVQIETSDSHSLQNNTEDIIKSEEHINEISKSTERPKRRSMISSLKAKNKIKEKNQSDSLLKSSNEQEQQKQINKEVVENQTLSDVDLNLQNISEDIINTESFNKTNSKSIEKSKRKSLLNLKTCNQIKEKSDEGFHSNSNNSNQIYEVQKEINKEQTQKLPNIDLSNTVINISEDVFNTEEPVNKTNNKSEISKLKSSLSSVKTRNQIKENEQSDPIINNSPEIGLKDFNKEVQIQKKVLKDDGKPNDLHNSEDIIPNTEEIVEITNKSPEKSNQDDPDLTICSFDIKAQEKNKPKRKNLEISRLQMDIVGADSFVGVNHKRQTNLRLTDAFKSLIGNIPGSQTDERKEADGKKRRLSKKVEGKIEVVKNDNNEGVKEQIQEQSQCLVNLGLVSVDNHKNEKEIELNREDNKKKLINSGEISNDLKKDIDDQLNQLSGDMIRLTQHNKDDSSKNYNSKNDSSKNENIKPKIVTNTTKPDKIIDDDIIENSQPKNTSILQLNKSIFKTPKSNNTSSKVNINQTKKISPTSSQQETSTNEFDDTVSCDPDMSTSIQQISPEENKSSNPLQNINLDNLPTGLNKTDQQNLPGSPILDTTADRCSEFLNNTLDISPIRTETPIETRDTKPETSSYETEEILSEIPNELPSDIQSVKSETAMNFIKTPSSRSMMLMNLLPQGMKMIKSPKFVIRKTPVNINGSPSTDRVRRMMLNCNGKSLVEKEKIKSDQIDEVNVLEFRKDVPSPFATPNRSILKRKACEVLEYGSSPGPKRKRVNFSDPPTTAEKIYFKDNAEEITEADRSFESIQRKSSPIYPSLINCTVDIKDILPNLNQENNYNNFICLKIYTVGDLAKLTSTQINQMDFLNNPRLSTVMSALNVFSEKFNAREKLTEELEEQENSLVPTEDANLPINGETENNALLVSALERLKMVDPGVSDAWQDLKDQCTRQQLELIFEDLRDHLGPK